MKFSVNWLRDFIELPSSVEELAELLTVAGIEIEGIEKRGANFDKVVVAQITASSQHPNADRLTVCEVDDGSGTKRQIVCGATNYKVGDKVPLALPGAILPSRREAEGGFQIKVTKMRGVDSEGMLCSAIELSLGEDAAGLLILSPETKIGAPISDLFPNDTILDVETTPNRGDLLSHFGLAREISALLGKPLRHPPNKAAGGTARSQKGVHISALRQCPFYSARRIEDVKVGPSPQWLRTKIEAAGIRPINNIVDISNFVMLDLGQPTHAFDADKLKGGINVRLALEGENFLALDGKTYTLTPQDLVIADQERVVGIGGVMGGEETGVTETTRNVLLESAYFLPTSIRRTARNLNLPSDASYRFERGVDPEMILPASNRATYLIQEIAGGNPAKEIAAAGKLPPNPPDVVLRYEKCDQVLGITIKPAKADQILEHFGLSKGKSITSKSKPKKNESTWQIPSYRRDLQRDVDLIEEVVRAHGVQKIAGTDRSRFTPSSGADQLHDFESGLRQRLVERGLSEVRTSKLISRKAAAFEHAVELRNPLSEDHIALRPSLYAALLEVLVRNVRAGAERLAIFELGRVFIPPNGREERHLGIMLWGNATSSVHWRSGEKRGLDYFDLKGAIGSLKIPTSFRRNPRPDFLLAVDIWSGDQQVGFAAQVPSERISTVGPTGSVLFAELNIDLIFHAETALSFRELDRFPLVMRDIAMIVPEKLSHAEIMAAIEGAREPLLATIELFDLFSGKEAASLGAGKKSLAYTLTYRDKTRTLTNDEISVVHAKIRERLQRELGVELRE